jgi:hypothetical protein
MHISVGKYAIHIVYLLHVSATHVAIFREVHYEGCVHRNVTEYREYRMVCCTGNINTPVLRLDCDLLSTHSSLPIRINHKYFVCILSFSM